MTLNSAIFCQKCLDMTNLAKSSVITIQCAEDDLRIIEETMDCAIKDFTCTYLGLPLTIRKPAKAELHPLIDKVADSLLVGKPLL